MTHQPAAKLIAWRLRNVATGQVESDVFTVSDFSALHWSHWRGIDQPVTLAEALNHLQGEHHDGDGYVAECHVIAWPANAML